MKKIFLSGLVFLLSVGAFSQAKLQLQESKHDFGVFKEEGGRQTYDFLVTNTGDAPLVITNVVPSCGCTTPEWTQSPIPPKGQGKVTAIYDPAGRPGPFEKTLVLHSNSVPAAVVLTIKGEVIPRVKTIEELFSFAVGPVRFESNHMAFTNVKKNERRIRVMPLINTSDSPVKVEFDVLPPHIQLKISPETLKPGQKGLVEGSYDGAKNPGWGPVNDMIKVKINGVVQNELYYYVSANLIEDFSKLTAADLENAPVFRLISTTVDLGKMEQNSSKEAEFRFRNEGKKDLNIRFIKSTCGCIAVQQGSPVIGPGKEGSIKVVFSSGGYPPGKQVKAIYVYTDDPRVSEAVLFMNAEIVAKEPGK